MKRRSLVLGALAVTMAHQSARADRYPSQPIRLIVPFSSGGAPDILARLLAREMADSGFGAAVVDNRGGAGGNIGADAVAKAKPDGYTLLLTTTATQSINPALYPAMPYDAERDFTAISLVATTPLMLVVAAQSKIASVADLIASAKATPNAVSYASAGVGTMQHITGELFAARAGVEMGHVPYKGTGQVVSDLLAGRVSVMFNSIAAVSGLVGDKKLRVLAVTTAQRLPAWPDVPTVAEAGLAGFEASAWYGIFGPAKLPADIVRQLNSEIGRIVALPVVRDRYVALGLEAATSSPAQLAEIVRNDRAKWGEVIKAKNIRVE